MTALSTAFMEFPATSTESTWPITNSLLDDAFLVSPSSGGGSDGAPDGEKSFFNVFGVSLLERGRTENSMLRIFSVLIVLPASTHFLRRSARFVLSWPLLVFASIKT